MNSKNFKSYFHRLLSINHEKIMKTIMKDNESFLNEFQKLIEIIEKKNKTNYRASK